MKIIKLELDNFFMYKGYEADFTKARKVKNIMKYIQNIELSSDDVNDVDIITCRGRKEKTGVSDININDTNIIIGGNAKEKRILAKFLWVIKILIHGGDIYDEVESIDTNKEYSMAIEYLVTRKNDEASKDYIFRYEVKFYDNKISFERLSYFALTKGENYNRDKFKKIIEFKNQNNDESKVVESKIFTRYLEERLKEEVSEEKILLILATNINYSYAHFGEGGAYVPIMQVETKGN